MREDNVRKEIRAFVEEILGGIAFLAAIIIALVLIVLNEG